MLNIKSIFSRSDGNIFISVLLVGLMLISLPALLYLAMKFLPAQKELSTSIPEVRDNRILVLPIDIESPAAPKSSLYFVYRPIIQELRQTPKGLEIITDVKDQFHPPFIINFNQITYVIYKRGDQLIPTDRSALKVGQRVSLEMYYEVEMGEWRLPEIYIIE